MEDKLSGRGVRKGSRLMDAYVRFTALLAAKWCRVGMCTNNRLKDPENHWSCKKWKHFGL